MLKLPFFTLISASLFASGAFAQTLDERIKLCLDDTLPTEKFDALIADLSQIKITFSQFVEQNAGICFTKLTGQAAEFKKGEGLVFDASAIEQVNEAREKAEKDRELAAANQAEEERLLIALAADAKIARQEKKCSLLADRADLNVKAPSYRLIVTDFERAAEARRREARMETVTQCNSWADDDMLAAITNPVCQAVFAEMGLPSSEVQGPSITDFIDASSSLASIETELQTIDYMLKTIEEEEKFVARSSELALQKWKAESQGQGPSDEQSESGC